MRLAISRLAGSQPISPVASGKLNFCKDHAREPAFTQQSSDSPWNESRWRPAGPSPFLVYTELLTTQFGISPREHYTTSSVYAVSSDSLDELAPFCTLTVTFRRYSCRSETEI